MQHVLVGAAWSWLRCTVLYLLAGGPTHMGAGASASTAVDGGEGINDQGFFEAFQTVKVKAKEKKRTQKKRRKKKMSQGVRFDPRLQYVLGCDTPTPLGRRICVTCRGACGQDQDANSPPPNDITKIQNGTQTHQERPTK